MTKHICSAKVVGQYVLNATTKQIDLIAPEIARSAVPGQFVNVQVSTPYSAAFATSFGCSCG
jgi:dihydroorotate dehydrogenase electron transfer subunit